MAATVYSDNQQFFILQCMQSLQDKLEIVKSIQRQGHGTLFLCEHEAGSIYLLYIYSNHILIILYVSLQYVIYMQAIM